MNAPASSINRMQRLRYRLKVAGIDLAEAQRGLDIASALRFPPGDLERWEARIHEFCAVARALRELAHE